MNQSRDGSVTWTGPGVLLEADPAPAPAPAEGPPAAVPLAGDLVAAATARLGVDRFARWAARALAGVPDCGCEARQRALNQIDQRLRHWLARPRRHRSDR